MISNDNITLKSELEGNHLGIATSDFKQGLDELSKDLESFKISCEKYTTDNPWQKDADLLLDSVNQILE